MKKAALIKGDNLSVINYYYNIIVLSLKEIGYKVDEIPYKSFNSKTFEVVVFGELLHSFFHKNRCKRIYWAQGIVPEESLMRNSSYIRYILLSFLEKRILKQADLLFFVSEEQKLFYEQKYKIELKDSHYLIMPCFNDYIHASSFSIPNKYKKNIFCYVGSLAVWQCFEKTVLFYKKIEDCLHDCELRVYTRDKDNAINILELNNVHNYSVEFVTEELLQKKLSECKFGFVLRENIAVNNIATPTKLSNYLANGVIPIFSDCLLSFVKLSLEFKYLIPITDNLEIENVLKYASQKISPEELLNEYSKIFDTYYNANKYIGEISSKLCSIL